MRFATAIPWLVALFGASSTVQGRRVPAVSTTTMSKGLGQQQQGQHENQLQQEQLQRHPQLTRSRWLGQIRGGAASSGLSAMGAVSPRSGAGDLLKRVRGGRTSDAVVLVEALVDTFIESSLIIGFVGVAESLSVRYLAETKFTEVARLVLWAAAVFASGAATAGPKKWLEKSQLFNIDVPLEKAWYENLRKPWWNPPNWVFPIMWIPLKILQVFACYEMWSNLEERSSLAAPVVVYAVYKSLGDVWNKVFFERRRLKIGTVVISVYFTLLLAGIKLFFDVSDRAGYLFAPTAAWVTVATCLQWSTWLLNRNEAHAKE